MLFMYKRALLPMVNYVPDLLAITRYAPCWCLLLDGPAAGLNGMEHRCSYPDWILGSDVPDPGKHGRHFQHP